MARYSNVTTNFSGGLITDNLTGRKDVDRVANSCRKFTNFFPSLQGPASYRPGFQLSHVDTLEFATKHRQVQYILGKDSAFRLVFTDRKLRAFGKDGKIKFTWVTGYTENQLDDLRFSSETSVIYICHPNHRPRKFEVIDNVSYLYEVTTYIEPFLQEEETTTKLDIVKGEEVAKVESTNADFQVIYSDYVDPQTGAGANTFSKDWYVEYEVNDIWLLGVVVDSATDYPEVTGPTSTVVFVDQVDFVTETNDPSAKFFVVDNTIPAADSEQSSMLDQDGVEAGEVHLRTDTDVFDSSQVGSWMRISEAQSSENVVVDTSSSMTRWVKIAAYEGTEVHPVEFARSVGYDINVSSTGVLHAVSKKGFYEPGSVYKSYGPMNVNVELPHDTYSGSSYTRAAYTSGIIRKNSNRTFSWSGGRFRDPGTASVTYSADDVVGNLSTALEVDVHRVDTTVAAVHSGNLNNVASNLVQPIGLINVTEVANDVSLVATAGIFTAATALNRHVRGVMPSGVVYMEIVERTSDTTVRARLKNPVPRSSVTGVFENSGRFKTFSMGAWYDNNYPADVVFYERRRVYGGTPANPNYVFFSKIDDEDTFAPSEDDKTVLDTNGISYPLSNVNSSVRWMIAAKELIVGTTRGIFSLSANEYDAAISPKTIRFELADEINCKDEAYMVGTSIFFPNESGTQLLEYKYDGAIQRSNGNDVSKFIFPLITDDGIKRIAIQETPQPRIWVLTTSGSLFCLTYQRQEEYYAWSKVEIANDTPIIDMVVLRETFDSGLDQFFIVINKFGFVQHEVLSSIVDSVNEPTIYMDSSESGYVGAESSAYNQITKELTITPTNLAVFKNNILVDVVLNGVYLGQHRVVSGVVKLRVLLGNELERWELGFKYDGRLQPMYPTWDGSNKPAYGSDNARIISSRANLVSSSRYSVGIDDKLDLVSAAGAVSTNDKVVTNQNDYIQDLLDSSGRQLLADEPSPTEDPILQTLVSFDSPKQVSFSGFDREKPLRGAYFGVDKTINIEQSEPYPLTIAALVTKTDLN